MTFSEHNKKFMSLALKEAEKAFFNNDVPIGAVIVYEKDIIAKAYNQVELLRDSTAHAEILAITSAENYLGNKNLSGCDLYVTIEPCVMCAGAIILSRISNVYFGAFEPKFGAAGSLFNILLSEKNNYKPNIYSGLLEDKAKSLMKEFFISKRDKDFLSYELINNVR